MTLETAAAYCDMSAVQFGRQCPVAPVDQGWRGLRWKRGKLDAWIEALPEKPRPCQGEAQNGIDNPAPASLKESAEARRAASLARL